MVQLLGPTLLLLVSFLLHPATSTIVVDSQTADGYDTELGSEAICWVTWKGNQEELPSDLFDLQEFMTPGIVNLQQTCPTGNQITPFPPAEFEQDGFRPRTMTFYDYTVHVELDTTTLVERLSQVNVENGGEVLPDDTSFISDKGATVAVQILGCVIDAGFCSPFIHEAANKRLSDANLPTSPKNKGDRHGGTHTHSGYVFYDVPQEAGPTYEFDITVPMLVNDPGEYYIIASAQMYLGNPANISLAGAVPLAPDAYARFDIGRAFPADELNQRIVQYQAPPTILSIDDWVLIVSYVFIGIAASILLFLLVETIRHRNHQVLQLTQGHFLISFLLTSLIVSVCTFLFEPKNDAYCNSVYPIVLIGLQLMYAIMIGRLWRINAVISPLLVQTLRQKNTWQSRFFNYLRQWSLFGTGSNLPKNKATNMRRQISDTQLTLVILLFALPQAILQVVRIPLQPLEATIDFNADESKGREVCEPSVPARANLIYYGFYLFILCVILLLVTSQYTRSLPSLFNETKVIFDSALSTLVLLVLGLAIIFMTDDPTVTPAVTYIVYVVWVLSMSLNLSLRVMLPKLRMVWRKEVVLVSKLVSDHAQSVRRDDAQYTNSFNISGLEPTTGGLTQRRPGQNRLSDVSSSGRYPSTAHSNSQEVMEDLTDYQVEDDGTGGIMKLDGTNKTDTEVTIHEHEGKEDGSAELADDEVEFGGLSSEPEPASHISYVSQISQSKLKAARRVTIAEKPTKKRGHLSQRIIVRQDEAPARRLLLKMIDLQNELGAINERIMSGLAASEDEWRALVKQVSRLDRTFENDVKFAWEHDSQELSEEQQMDTMASLHSIQQELIEEEADAETQPLQKQGSTSSMNILQKYRSKAKLLVKGGSDPKLETDGTKSKPATKEENKGVKDVETGASSGDAGVV